MRRPTFIARQAGHPSGWLGRLLLRVMAGETVAFNREVLDALTVRDNERVLEIGYGHGRTLLDAATRAPQATFAGIDISPDAARVASRRCKELVASGRVELQTGDAVELPWGDRAFDAVYSVHTIYFWQEPERTLASIRRVLSASGRLVLGMRDRNDIVSSHFPPSVYRFYSADEVAALLRGAAFSRVDVRQSMTNEQLRIVIANV